MFKRVLRACLPLVALTAILFNSCNKDELPPAQTPAPTTGYYTKFKVDGVQQEYFASQNLCLFDQFDTALGEGHLSFVARLHNDTLGRNHFVLSLTDSVPLSLNTVYTNYTTLQPNERGLIAGGFDFTYWDDNRHYTFTLNESLALPSGLISDARLTITEITPQYIKGRFSGSVYDINYTTIIHVISDGEFFLPHI